MTSRQARRRSAEAMARNFQRVREDYMEVDVVPDSSTYARARDSSPTGGRHSSSSLVRAGGSSHAEEAADEPRVPKKSTKKKSTSTAKYLEVLLERGFEGTKYPHRETMKKLGIARDLDYLYEMGGLSTFMRIQLEGYKEETCHFLASLAVHFYDEEPDYESDGGPGFITFTCRGRSFFLTIKEIDALYGFSGGDEPIQDFDHEELQQLWSTIGDIDKPFSSSRSKSSSIRSPVLRYLHKTIASTMFARKVTGTVNEGELKILDLCLLSVLDRTRDGTALMGDRAAANLTFVLLEQFLNYKDWALRMHRMESGGELCIGGIVTPILVACGVELLSEPYPPKWIDIETLRRCRFLAQDTRPDDYLYKFTHPSVGESKLRLPCTDLTKVREGTNIDFNPPVDRLYDPNEVIAQEESSPEEHFDIEANDDTERFSFEEYSLKAQSSQALKEAHKRIGLLQKWNKFQGKTIAALKGTMNDLKDQMKEVKDQLKKFTAPSSKKVVLPRRVLAGSGSFREGTRPQAPAMEPPRASSFEPRQTQHYVRQKRRSAAGASSSSRQIESSDRAQHMLSASSSHQLDPRSVEPSYTRESMEDSISSFFSQP